ncbi:hypothetical protein [Streptomyces sp. NBC_01320]|uniref:hypothetical protein n=1 Tax=Streptomyces sp. NBC_01320 TaxID=2903824 RepID=UPI002E107383|nr:hypothetical protein OG395_02760 [Streptomyces sp. NBC_01320]WSK00802.1 hypothetical protein OG395_52580 [Streptomyces sp. NBC_01320]
MGPEENTGSATARAHQSPGPTLRRATTALRHGTGTTARTARRAARVTLAAAAFYTGLYGLHDPVTATYALFAAVAMAGLSRIPGTGHQHAAVVAQVLPAGWILVTAGTLLAVHTRAAVAGMLLIGFLLSTEPEPGTPPTEPGTPATDAEPAAVAWTASICAHSATSRPSSPNRFGNDEETLPAHPQDPGRYRTAAQGGLLAVARDRHQPAGPARALPQARPPAPPRPARNTHDPLPATCHAHDLSCPRSAGHRGRRAPARRVPQSPPR